MIFYAVLGVGVWLLFKRNPQHAHKLLQNTNNIVKYLPIEKSSMDLLSPILDFTNTTHSSFMENMNNINPMGSMDPKTVTNPLNHTRQHKRVVSETKKKYVASRQDWKCGICQTQLDHTFEIDHKIRLEYGGDNEVTNLIALCRNCHGQKTAKENM
jgi:predicted restriction endonuclease